MQTPAHHAWLLRVSDIAQADLPAEYTVPSTDVQHVVVERFGISEARDLTQAASTQSVTGTIRTFVIATESITVEAQNALLKLFEEPPAQVQFYLLTTAELLPTLHSRLLTVETQPEQSENQAVWQAFVGQSYAERLDEIAKRSKAKDLSWQNAVAAGAAQFASTSIDLSSKQAITLVVSRFHDRGASRKMLLEELALSVPL